MQAAGGAHGEPPPPDVAAQLEVIMSTVDLDFESSESASASVSEDINLLTGRGFLLNAAGRVGAVAAALTCGHAKVVSAALCLTSVLLHRRPAVIMRAVADQ